MRKKVSHKIFTLFLAIAVFFTYMPFSTLLGYDNTAFAASYSGTLKQSERRLKFMSHDITQK